MTVHNASNPNCDKNQYGDASDVRCTCDVDSADDVPEPSVAVKYRHSEILGREVLVMPHEQVSEANQPLGAVLLQGRQASAHREWLAAGVEFKAAQDLFAKAKARWDAALQAYAQEMIG